MPAAPSSPSASKEKTSSHQYENYDKPIVLLGLSSSPRNNELQRLALSLSGALAGDDPRKLRETVDWLERSQGAGILDEEDDRKRVAGISLSALGLDEEGPFVLDAALIRELISKKTLSLDSGVIVLDFNHAAFHDAEGYNAKEYEGDLIRALASVAKQLYEDKGLLSVYVNVQPDDKSAMGDDAKERRGLVEEEVLIPFSDYELCIKDEGILIGDGGGGDDPMWADAECELRRMIARALLPPPAAGAGPNKVPNNNADLMMGANTFFLNLSFPKVEDAAPHIERMCRDVDSMEYRVDLLQAAKDYLAADGNGGNVATMTKPEPPRSRTRS